MSKLPPLIFSILFLAALTGGLLYSIRDYGALTNANITQSVTLRLHESTLYAAQSFRHQLNEKLVDLQGMARYLSAQKDLVSQASVSHYSALLLGPGLRNFGIVGPDGKGFSAQGRRLNLSAEGYFQRALQGRASISSDIVASDNGRRILAIAVPVLRESRVSAVLVGGINTDALEQSLENNAFDSQAYNLVFDSHGRILFGTNPPGQNLNYFLTRLDKEQPDSPLSPERLRAVFRENKDGKNDVEHFESLGSSFFMSHAPLQQNDWQLVSILPQWVVSQQISRHNEITTMLMLRIAGIAALLLFYLLYTQRRSYRKLRQQQEEYSTIISNISGGVQKISDINGNFLFISPNYLELLGYSREEFEKIYENNFANTIYEEDREEALQTMARQLENSKSMDVEYRTRAKNGNLIWLYNKGTLITDDHNHPYIYSIVFDITHNKDMQQAQRISDERYHFILEQHDIIIFEQDLLNGDFYCSTRWLQLFGGAFNILEPDPDGSQVPVHQDDRETLHEFQEALQQGKRVAEMRLRGVDGPYRWYRIEASNIMDESGWPIYVIGIITDIDAQKNLELNLRNQASRDSATGIYNKIATEQAITRFLAAHPLEGPGSYALFMIDFDNFKTINDRLGHAVGDQAIYAMSQIIRHNFRLSDIVGRIGGDEFLVLCTERMSMENIRGLAGRLVSELRTEWGEGDEICVLTASVGIACAPQDGRTFAQLYQHADEATYQAKHNGKNGCVFYEQIRATGTPPPAGASVVNEIIDAAPDEKGRQASEKQ